MRPAPCALGFRVHSGWAAMVVVAGSPQDPEILVRRRIEFADFANHSTVQPYHAAAEMPLAAAEKFVARSAAEARELAQRPIRQVIEELRPRRVAIAAITLSSGRFPTSLEGILASHAAIHTAEGEHFRAAVRGACEDCGLRCAGSREKEILAIAAKTFALTEASLQAMLADLGKLLGPPWRQDEKLASLAAWLALKANKAENKAQRA